jgi:photosystem II stability/assembly factor-like uncharacterized protein
MKTTNGGVNWSMQNAGGIANLYGICFTSALTGYIGASSGDVYKTTNGGANWNVQTTGLITPLHSICFVDNNNGFAGGWQGKIVKTTNAGANWSILTSGVTQHINRMHSLDLMNVYAVTDNSRFLFTTNGGANWSVSILAEANSNSLKSIYFLNVNTGIITGNYGTQLIYNKRRHKLGPAIRGNKLDRFFYQLPFCKHRVRGALCRKYDKNYKRRCELGQCNPCH